MLGIILLVVGIVLATRIPKTLKSTPADFPGCDPEVHARWKKKELGSIYVFLVATWGQLILFFFIGLAVGVMFRGSSGRLGDIVVILTAIEVIVFLVALIWSAVLGSQAAKLKKMLPQGGAHLPPSYYPRPGQELLVSPPPVAPTPPAEPNQQPPIS